MKIAHLLFVKSEPQFTPELDSVEIYYSKLTSEMYDVLIWVIYVRFLYNNYIDFMINFLINKTKSLVFIAAKMFVLLEKRYDFTPGFKWYTCCSISNFLSNIMLINICFFSCCPFSFGD